MIGPRADALTPTPCFDLVFEVEGFMKSERQVAPLAQELIPSPPKPPEKLFTAVSEENDRGIPHQVQTRRRE